MGNYDQFNLAVKELSGGKCVSIMDDAGLPSVYVAIPKGYNGNVIAGGNASKVHPAFIVNGVEKKSFYFSKYQNVVFENRAYSLSRREPLTSINHDTAKAYCTNKGKGFHLATVAEWAYIALWCRKNGTMPHGNNNYGCDINHAYETGTEASKDGNRTGKILTGSGPVTWNHNHQGDGICDMNGNVWEWMDGMRLNNGEINIIADNNAALGADCDTSAASTLWKAILSDGSLVTPGTSGTLKYDFVSNNVQLTAGTPTFNKDQGVGGEYKNMTLASGLVAPELAKALILYPDEPGGDYAGDYHWFNPSGERLPLCGGFWGIGASAGVFSLSLHNPRSSVSWSVGFRSAFVDL